MSVMARIVLRRASYCTNPAPPSAPLEFFGSLIFFQFHASNEKFKGNVALKVWLRKLIVFELRSLSLFVTKMLLIYKFRISNIVFSHCIRAAPYLHIVLSYPIVVTHKRMSINDRRYAVAAVFELSYFDMEHLELL